MREIEGRIEKIEIMSQLHVQNLNEVERTIASLREKLAVIPTTDLLRRQFDRCIAEHATQEGLRVTIDRLYTEKSESIQLLRTAIRQKSNSLHRISNRIPEVENEISLKNSAIARLKRELNDAESINCVLKRSRTQREADRRFDIQRAKSARIETLTQVGEARQHQKLLRKTKADLLAKLHSISRKSYEIGSLNQFYDRSTEEVTVLRIPDTGDLSQMIDRLVQLKQHIVSARQYEEQLSNHMFFDLPVIVPPQRDSKIGALVSKLKSLHRRNRRWRRAIRQFERPGGRPVAHFDAHKTKMSKSCQPPDNAGLEDRVSRLRESIVQKRDQTQQKRKRLACVFDWPAEPQYSIHFCNRCLHRIEEYRMGGTDWAELHKKLLDEIRRWTACEFPAVVMLSIWNNKLEHFMKQVARPL
jgi:hypothetical protein